MTPETESYLRSIVIPLRLACISTTGWPAILSLWYEYAEGVLYCATRGSARVVSYLQDEPRCAFEIAADEPPYCGVRGPAVATIDAAAGDEILRRLLVRYLGSTETPLGRRLLAQSQDEVAIVLTPVKVFTWNYTDRMKDSVATAGSKPRLCP